MCKKSTFLKSPLVVVLLFCAFLVKGQESINIEKLTDNIDFDGVPDEQVWQQIEPFKMVMHYPDFGEEPSEKSTVRIAYDKQNLWVSAILSYNSLDDIVSTSEKRDESFPNADAFGIVLDTYNDNENGAAFFTMPAGQRIDFSIMNDAEGFGGLRNGNYSWNTFWDVKTARVQNGWTLEMKIPFSSLRFQSTNGNVEMGVLLVRNISRANEIDTYPSIDPAYGASAPLKPSLSVPIKFSEVKESKPIYLSPYIIDGNQTIYSLNETKEVFEPGNNNDFNAGFDLKYSITSNITMDLTVNTDFAQVEVDDAQINLTRFSLFLPEKRSFFQEHSSIFNFSLGGPENLFYSRRIGLDNGEAVPIIGGGRITGRVGSLELGVMDMHTRSSRGDGEFDNFGVVRLRKQVINDYSYIGGILTSRIGNNGEKFYSYGCDGIFRVFDNDYMELKFAQTTDSTFSGDASRLDKSFISFDWDRRNSKGLGYGLSYSRSGKEFDPKVGFLSYSGLSKWRGRIQYGWFADQSSKLVSYSVNFMYTRSTIVGTHSLMSGFYGPGCEFTTRKGWKGRFGLTIDQQGLDQDFYLCNDVCVKAGEYNYPSSKLTISSPISKPVSTRLSVSGGDYYDGKKVGATIEPIINISSKVNLQCYYDINHIRFSERNQEFLSQIARLKLTYMYNTKWTVNSFVQYNSLSNLTQTNLKLRYNPKEGNDLYIVYNELRPTAAYFNEDEPTTSVLNRVVQIKYVHTFQL